MLCFSYITALVITFKCFKLNVQLHRFFLYLSMYLIYLFIFLSLSPQSIVNPLLYIYPAPSLLLSLFLSPSLSLPHKVLLPLLLHLNTPSRPTLHSPLHPHRREHKTPANVAQTFHCSSTSFLIGHFSPRCPAPGGDGRHFWDGNNASTSCCATAKSTNVGFLLHRGALEAGNVRVLREESWSGLCREWW